MISSPFFIIGAARSGTTFFTLMLNSHSRIAVPFESHFFPEYYSRRDSLGDLENSVKDRLYLIKSILAEPFVASWDKRVEPEELDIGNCTSLEKTIDQIYAAYARKHGKSIWGDKSPSYIMKIDVLNRMFPSSKFIHIIRDGRDVAMSVAKQWWGEKNFMTAVDDWARNVDRARKMLRMLPYDRHMELRFEDLVCAPARELRRVTGFLGLDFEEKMLNSCPEDKAREFVNIDLKTDHSHLSEPPSLSQTYKWRQKLSSADQAIASEIGGNLFRELDYPEGVTRHRLKIFKKYFHRIKAVYTGKMRRFQKRPATAWIIREQLKTQNGYDLAPRKIWPFATGSGGEQKGHPMRLSVIIPCFNAAGTIASQLEALAAQKWSEPWEIIISDNGSTDNTLSVVERYRDILPNMCVVDASARRGASHAKNAGAKASTAESLAFCDADDEVAPGWVAAMGKALMEHDIVACRMDISKLNPPWVLKSRRNPQESGIQRYSYPPYLPHAGGGTLGVSRRLFGEIGGFDETCPLLEDTDFCWKTQLNGFQIHFEPEAVMCVRFRESLKGIYRQAKGYGEYNVKIYKRYLPLDMPRLSRMNGVQKWIRMAWGFAKAVPVIRDKGDIAFWAWQWGYNIGRLKGSLKYRVFAL